MSKTKRIDILCIVVTAVTLLLTVLFMCGEKLGLTVVHHNESSAASDRFTANDLNGAWDTQGATRIVLSGDTAQISGNGAYFHQGTLYIVYAGRYVLSGELSGSVKVDADGDDKIWLLFDGVDITSDSDAPLHIEQADKVFLTLGEGTENTLTFTLDDESATVDGAIYSRDDLTINGSGRLTVRSEYLHGIVCNDTLVLAGGTVNITAKVDGVHAHDAIKIRDTAITVQAGDDGLHAGNDDGDAVFYLESGTVTVTESYEGIEANDITIAGGTVTIAATDDGINANGDGTNSLITISGGDITIINRDGRDADGLDSNGSIRITGGNLFISLNGIGSNSAVDYGSENGGTFTISGGTVIACGGSQMAEGPESASAQGFVMQTVSGSAGSAVMLTDAEGTVLLEKEIPCAFTSAILSTPEISVGDTVTLKIDDTETAITVDNSAAGGMGGFPGGSASFGNRSADRPGAPGEAMPDTSDGNVPNMPEGSRPTLPEDRGSDDGSGSNLPSFGNGSESDASGRQNGSGMKPPALPDDGVDGGTDMDTGASNGQNGSRAEPPALPDGEADAERSGDENEQSRPGEMKNFSQREQTQNDASSDSEPTLSREEMLRIGVWVVLSALVLLGGLLAAAKHR